MTDHTVADHDHVDSAERHQALDPHVGDGTPDAAPDTLHIDDTWEPPASWLPTRKWLARTVVAAGGLASTWAAVGEWSADLTGALITAVVAALVSYLVPND
jgi:hypothetical protein